MAVQKSEYDIFISYRRNGGETMAILLHDRLKAKGYNVFIDVESLNSGSFNEKLLSVIEDCKDVVVILAEHSLDRCINDGDWVRMEIAHAFKHSKNVIPFMLRGFKFPDNLPDDIAPLSRQNGVNANNNEYFDAAINRLSDKFLDSEPDPANQVAEIVKKRNKPLIAAFSVASVLLTALICAIVVLMVNPGDKKTMKTDLSGDITQTTATTENTETTPPATTAKPQTTKPATTTAKKPTVQVSAYDMDYTAIGGQTSKDPHLTDSFDNTYKTAFYIHGGVSRTGGTWATFDVKDYDSFSGVVATPKKSIKPTGVGCVVKMYADGDLVFESHRFTGDGAIKAQKFNIDLQHVDELQIRHGAYIADTCIIGTIYDGVFTG